MYDLVYARNKKLKDDSRMFYYSFASVMGYPEVPILIAYVAVYMTASGININLTHVRQV